MTFDSFLCNKIAKKSTISLIWRKLDINNWAPDTFSKQITSKLIKLPSMPHFFFCVFALIWHIDTLHSIQIEYEKRVT